MPRSVSKPQPCRYQTKPRSHQVARAQRMDEAQMALMGYTHQNAVTLAALEKARAAIAKARGTPC